MIPSPEGATEMEASSFLVRSVARYRGLRIHVRPIPGLTPGATICRHLRWLVESFFLRFREGKMAGQNR